MSERKVLNKYYPADYDPSKIPRAKRPKNRQWTIRTMAPFNMRCNTCGEYIYKGKKFNSRQEVAEGEKYLTMKIFRFYIKCPKCVSEITFKTDPQSLDYVLEAGATRNFEALRTAELMAQKEAAEKEAELENNPMKMLENRTKASQREMDMLETLEDLRELNSKHQKVDMDGLIEEKVRQQKMYEEKLQQLQDEEDEAFAKSIFSKEGDCVVRRLEDSDEEKEDKMVPPSKQRRMQNPTDLLGEDPPEKPLTSVASSTGAETTTQPQRLLVGSSKPSSTKPKKTSLSMLVKRKDPADKAKPTTASKPSLYELVKKKETTLLSNASKVDANGANTDTKNNVINGTASSSNVTSISSDSGSAARSSGLSLLGGYSDSGEGSEND